MVDAAVSCLKPRVLVTKLQWGGAGGVLGGDSKRKLVLRCPHGVLSELCTVTAYLKTSRCLFSSPNVKSGCL